MRIIVVGAGKVGTALCRSLVEEKHDVILIEEKEEVEMELILKFWNKPKLATVTSLSR